MNLGGLVFVTKEFEKGVADLDRTVQNNTAVYGQKIGQMFQSTARSGAKWTDRRGVARRGIYSDSQATPTKVKVSMGMKALNYKKRGPRSARDYSEYLEFAHGGQFAIVYPTIDAMEKSVIENFGQAALSGKVKVQIDRDQEAYKRRMQRYKMEP